MSYDIYIYIFIFTKLSQILKLYKHASVCKFWIVLHCQLTFPTSWKHLQRRYKHQMAMQTENVANSGVQMMNFVEDISTLLAKKEKDYQHLPQPKKTERGLDCSSKRYVDFGVSSPALDLGVLLGSFAAWLSVDPLEGSRKLRSSGHKMPSLPLLLLLD